MIPPLHELSDAEFRRLTSQLPAAQQRVIRKAYRDALREQAAAPRSKRKTG